jgi:anti-sigma B factor antagonist
MAEDQPNLKVTQQGDVHVVEFEDRKILEELLINQIGEQVGQIVIENPNPKLLLDFKNVQHLSSAALGMLITLNKQVIDRKGQLVLTNIHPQIFEVFKITRLNKVFNIQSNTESALQAFS